LWSEQSGQQDSRHAEEYENVLAKLGMQIGHDVGLDAIFGWFVLVAHPELQLAAARNCLISTSSDLKQ